MKARVDHREIERETPLQDHLPHQPPTLPCAGRGGGAALASGKPWPAAAHSLHAGRVSRCRAECGSQYGREGLALSQGPKVCQGLCPGLAPGLTARRGKAGVC